MMVFLVLPHFTSKVVVMQVLLERGFRLVMLVLRLLNLLVLVLLEWELHPYKVV